MPSNQIAYFSAEIGISSNTQSKEQNGLCSKNMGADHWILCFQ